MAGVIVKGLRYCANTEPYLVACGFALVTAAAIPTVVLPYRKSQGGDTFINDHDLSHPLLNDYRDHRKEPNFQDMAKLKDFLARHPDPYKA
mmetsp:Transcript_16987/g.39948  ORF Transcript_16987/g.39948 Transcript_16987/m.39948 type:complete len:91 (-) Transcript_16987:49-321(-)